MVENTHSDKFAALRQRAEEVLQRQPEELREMPPEEVQRLVHELQVHQIELEMQNDELRRTQHKYSDLYDSAPVGYFTLDEHGLILEANLTGATLLGVERGDLIRTPLHLFIAEDGQDMFYLHCRRVFEARTPQTDELRMVKRDGTPFYAQLDSIVVQGNQCRTIISDITERVRAAEERQRLYEQVQRDAETKAALLNEVNHRVINNLTAIMGLLQAERNRAEMADQDAYRAIMQNLINRVGGLAAVHRLLSAYEWAPLRLSDVAGQVVRSSLQMLPRHKGASIDLTPSSVRVTPDQAHNLALVINELATNTVKYALGERDAVHIAVGIALEDEDGMVRLEYRDDGPGYPEDVLQLERYNVGFELVQNMVGRSLRGELSLHNDEGAVAVIRFKAQG
jgi:PAS domain S-box-containing protein